MTGHGEVEATPVLVRNVLARRSIYDIRPSDQKDVIRKPEGQILRRDSKVLDLSVERLRNRFDAVLVLLDLEDDCPATVGPELERRVRDVCGNVPSAVVICYRELETWFLHDAKTLFDVEPPADPEARRDAKGWIRKNARAGYNEKADSPGLCAGLNMDQLTKRSDSFRVFVDRIESIAQALSAPAELP